MAEVVSEIGGFPFSRRTELSLTAATTDNNPQVQSLPHIRIGIVALL